MGVGHSRYKNSACRGTNRVIYPSALLQWESSRQHEPSQHNGSLLNAEVFWEHEMHQDRNQQAFHFEYSVICSKYINAGRKLSQDFS